ncbi:unnamed protein product [Closterium sp. NIES-54]
MKSSCSDRAAGGAAGAGTAGAAGPGGAGAGGIGTVGGPAGVGAAGGAGAASPGGAHTGGTGAAGAGGAAGVGAVGAGAVTTGGAAGAGAVGGTGAGGGVGVVARDPGGEGTGAVSAVSGGAARPRPYYVPLLQQPACPLTGPSPYSRPTRGLSERREPASRPASPESRPASPESRPESHVCPTHTGRYVPHQRPPPVPGTHSMTLRPSTAPQRVPLPSPLASSLPALADQESDSLRTASPTVMRLLATVVTDPFFESTAASALVAELVDFAAHSRLDYAASLVPESESASVCPPPVELSMLLAPEGDPDAQDIPTPRSYAEAIEGPYSSQWQAAMDDEMASWKSTGTYVNEVPPPGANIVSGIWISRVKRPPGSLPVFKARYVSRGFSQRQGVDFFQTFSPTPKMTTLRVLLHVAAQRDYELHSLDFGKAFLQGSLHEEIWLRHPPGFTGSFPAGTQWSLSRPVYGLRQAPREWHDTLRTTLAALGFVPSPPDPSLFLHTDTTLPPFYVLVYVDDLVFATADTEALAHVKSELQKRHTCTDLGELTSYLGLRITWDRAQRTITLIQSHMVQQVLQRFGFTYSSPQSTPLPAGHLLSAPPLDEFVEPSGPYPELVGCLITSGMGLVLGGRARVVLIGHADASWELRWLTYLLTDLGEAPRSPLHLYVDNKAMLALCQEHRLEHRTKHIALRYFLARELQERGQLHLAYLSFTLDSGASSCFFRDHTDLTLVRTPVTVTLADPSVGPVVARSTTTLPYPAAPSGFLTCYYTPSFSRNLVGVTTFPVDEPVVSWITTSVQGALCGERLHKVIDRGSAGSLATVEAVARSRRRTPTRRRRLRLAVVEEEVGVGSAGFATAPTTSPLSAPTASTKTTSAKNADSFAGGKGQDDKEASCSLVGVVEPTVWLAPEAVENFQAVAAAVQANPAVVLLDSGCLHHLMGTKEAFVDLEPSGDVKHMCGFNGALQDVRGRGTVALQGEAGKQVLIPDVFYVPGVQANLLAFGQLKESGVRLTDDGDKMLLVSAAIDVLGRAMYNGRVLCTDLLSCTAKSMTSMMEVEALRAILSATKSTPAQWHARLAHVVVDTITSSAKHTVATCLDIKPSAGTDSLCV